MNPHDDPRFLKGVQEFNDRLFFEWHETLEEIWLEDHGEVGKFYQAIIQIAAGYFKLEQGVPDGGPELWRMGLEKLLPYRPTHLGIGVDALVESVTADLAKLDRAHQQGAAAAVVPPTIHFIC